MVKVKDKKSKSFTVDKTAIIYNRISPLTMWVWFLLMARYTWYIIMSSSLSVTCGRSVIFFWFPPSIKKPTTIQLKYCWKWCKIP
jgi:hypothetical protein